MLLLFAADCGESADYLGLICQAPQSQAMVAEATACFICSLHELALIYIVFVPPFLILAHNDSKCFHRNTARYISHYCLPVTKGKLLQNHNCAIPDEAPFRLTGLAM